VKFGFFHQMPPKKTATKKIPPFDLILEAMAAAVTATEAILSTIQESVQLSMTLGRIALNLKQENMLVDLKKMMATLVRTTTALPMFALSRVLEQPKGKS
jgi:hypothetical protein